jgi:8-oxo-dGTP pyrophosphatase MutT (NUDIX family)
MTDVRYDDRRFRVRAAGVAIRDGRVLLNGWDGFRHLALPGGGVELHESSDAALVREMREELGVDVRVGRLLWVVESFFALNGERFHEVGFYWEMTFPETAVCVRRTAFEALESDGGRMSLAWVPLGDLDDVDLVPTFLVAGLRDLPTSTRFLVHVDRESQGSVITRP